MPRSKRFILIAASLALILAIVMAMNVEVSTRQGFNGHVRLIRMPLYVKAMGFLARNYEYQRMVKEITRGCHTEEEKVLAIFNWTHENIKPVPPGMPVVDDHILNIIIRGYGSVDQSQDVFTTLCCYAGIPAMWEQAYAKGRTVWYPVSLVRIGGKWRVFDSYYNKYFRNKNGEIASIEDIVTDRSIIAKSGIAGRLCNGIPCEEFYYNLKPVKYTEMTRPEQQMPLKRLVFEIEKAIGLKRQHDPKIAHE